jgi:hypothetical protein
MHDYPLVKGEMSFAEKWGEGILAKDIGIATGGSHVDFDNHTRKN